MWRSQQVEDVTILQETESFINLTKWGSQQMESVTTGEETDFFLANFIM